MSIHTKFGVSIQHGGGVTAGTVGVSGSLSSFLMASGVRSTLCFSVFRVEVCASLPLPLGVRLSLGVIEGGSTLPFPLPLPLSLLRGLRLVLDGAALSMLLGVTGCFFLPLGLGQALTPTSLGGGVRLPGRPGSIAPRHLDTVRDKQSTHTLSNEAQK